MCNRVSSISYIIIIILIYIIYTLRIFYLSITQGNMTKAPVSNIYNAQKRLDAMCETYAKDTCWPFNTFFVLLILLRLTKAPVSNI